MADADDLVTLRDVLRYGVTRFTRARLVYGHGTARALDEAAFLVLTALDLPPDMLDPWLDCRLTLAERRRILDLFEARITTRVPAPYLVNTAYIQSHRFYVDPRVIVPRSYLGELLLADGLAAILPDPDAVTAVLDLGTGSGCLAILAALTYPEARVDAIDLSADALAVAARNVADYDLDGRIRLCAGDLYAALDGANEPAGRHGPDRDKDGDGNRGADRPRYDLILANPPYVADAEIAAFPPEYRAEPVMAHAGGADGLDLVRRILAGARGCLTPGGVLVMEIGTGRATFEADYPDLDVLWLDSETSRGEVLAVTATALG